MEVQQEDINKLLELQELDAVLNKAQKDFNELPERGLIKETREKCSEVLKKKDQLDAMQQACEEGIEKLETEDAALLAKQKQVQADIDASGGDYRNLEARTKELNGISRRRLTLEEELGKKAEELDKLEGLSKQVQDALALLKEREEKATASFQKKGSALREKIVQLEKQRKGLTQSIDAALLKKYGDLYQRCGGVVLGYLKESICGVCRSPIEPGRLSELKRQAPLASCPHCKRLLIIRN